MRKIVEKNIIDRIVNFFDPVRAAHRHQARAYMALTGGYTGARKDRRQTSEWIVSNSDSNSDLLPALDGLRERSRDLVRNNPIARGAINSNVTNVVGTGLRVNPQIDSAFLKLTEEQARAWETEARQLFELFADECDITGQLKFHELQDLVLRSSLESGDVFVVRRMLEKPEPGGLFRHRLQVLEGDRVSNPNNKADSATLAGGVEINKTTGKVLRYHITDSHPGMTYRPIKDWTPINARRNGEQLVLHIYQRLRPGQLRGEPYLAPVIETLKQIDRYTEAELMAAVVSGMLAVFIKTENRAGFSATEPTTETGGSSTDKDFKLASGMMVDLAPGEDIETVNPGRPNPAFDPFMTAILRQVGIALEIPFEVLLKHFTASYSASRAALEMAWQYFIRRRFWLVDRFCDPVYAWAISEAVARGLLPAPGFFDNPLIKKAYLGTQWVGPARLSLDPVKDSTADQAYLNMGVKTLSEITVERTGGDWKRKNEQRSVETKARRDAGLVDEPSDPTETVDEKDTEE